MLNAAHVFHRNISTLEHNPTHNDALRLVSHESKDSISLQIGLFALVSIHKQQFPLQHTISTKKMHFLILF
jgi:uncharacterized protein YjiK